MIVLLVQYMLYYLQCSSCTIYVVLFAMFLSTSIIISSALVYFYWYSRKEDSVFRLKFNPSKKTTIYRA